MKTLSQTSLVLKQGVLLLAMFALVMFKICESRIDRAETDLLQKLH